MDKEFSNIPYMSSYDGNILKAPGCMRQDGLSALEGEDTVYDDEKADSREIDEWIAMHRWDSANMYFQVPVSEENACVIAVHRMKVEKYSQLFQRELK